MKLKLIATTAMMAILSTGAMAAEKTDQAAGEKTSPELTFNIFSSTVSPEATVSRNGYLSAKPGQVLATGLLGKEVYSGAPNGDEEPELIGDVNDIVMTGDGVAKAAVIGVGGFVGLGEKDVAVDFKRIQWRAWDGEPHLVLTTSKEDLETAPEFNREGVTMMQDANMLVIDQSNLSADRLIGTSVYGKEQGELDDIGEIGDVILTPDQKIEAYVVDVGGFLGIGAKPVEMSASQLTVYVDAAGALHVYTPFTRAELEGMPAYEVDNEQISLTR
ncbi:PRC-barrel domain-containing protein [Cohaesibacter sp. ES.047]|uniref:PRC-barrel domain-containing protein n=1 Tax=Cohaesibacter sp. ES.047 TaxID=1798205 RepID=UPI000BB858B6|nr:PRC-barrel domain-containing protein [Cohaesibacter sp. ES.047]SNY91318.1 PRC-barrel domain-containing protein [Cohaesibacter sp. ES.047]